MSSPTDNPAQSPTHSYRRSGPPRNLPHRSTIRNQHPAAPHQTTIRPWSRRIDIPRRSLPTLVKSTGHITSRTVPITPTGHLAPHRFQSHCSDYPKSASPTRLGPTTRRRPYNSAPPHRLPTSTRPLSARSMTTGLADSPRVMSTHATVLRSTSPDRPPRLLVPTPANSTPFEPFDCPCLPESHRVPSTGLPFSIRIDPFDWPSRDPAVLLASIQMTTLAMLDPAESSRPKTTSLLLPSHHVSHRQPISTLRTPFLTDNPYLTRSSPSTPVRPPMP